MKSNLCDVSKKLLSIHRERNFHFNFSRILKRSPGNWSTCFSRINFCFEFTERRSSYSNQKKRKTKIVVVMRMHASERLEKGCQTNWMERETVKCSRRRRKCHCWANRRLAIKFVYLTTILCHKTNVTPSHTAPKMHTLCSNSAHQNTRRIQ